MTDEILYTTLTSWSDSEFAVAASGEFAEDLKSLIEGTLAKQTDRIEAMKAENAKLSDALFPFAEFWQLGGGMNDPISKWFTVAPFVDAVDALQETTHAAAQHGLWLLDDERDDLIEAFARHRLAERARIVAWLREKASEFEKTGLGFAAEGDVLNAALLMKLANSYKFVASAIEAGEHETFTHPDNV